MDGFIQSKEIQATGCEKREVTYQVGHGNIRIAKTTLSINKG